MFSENDERMKSPIKKSYTEYNIYKEEKDKQIINSPSYKNNVYYSPLPKTNSNSNNDYNHLEKFNKNEDYSPYVKRINISEVKEGENKINIKKENEIMPNKYYFTSYKKNSRKIYLPSPNINKSDEKLSDRFIPFNQGINLLDKFNLTSKFNEVDENNCENITFNYEERRDNKDLYNKILKYIFLKEYNNLSTEIKNKKRDINKLFSYKQEKQKNLKNFFYDFKNEQEIINNNSRKINTKPYKVLSAPNLMDDFYLNLLD